MHHAACRSVCHVTRHLPKPTTCTPLFLIQINILGELLQFFFQSHQHSHCTFTISTNFTCLPTNIHPHFTPKKREREREKMAPQYDNIGSQYSLTKLLPVVRLETATLHAILSPHLPCARALDLASGTGHISRSLVSWGVSSVIGVDVSPAMAAVAQAESALLRTRETVTDLEFTVGDAVTLGKLSPEDKGFEIVVAGWLLNYAANEAELVGMFKTVAENLNGRGEGEGKGGVFVAITLPPRKRAEFDAFAASMNDPQLDKRRRKCFGVSYDYHTKVDNDGWEANVAMLKEDGEEKRFVMKGYHFPTEVIERAARKGGLHGKLEWRNVKMEEEMREDAIKDHGEEFWNEYFEIGPHFGVLVVEGS